jgi:hypothetical protein
MRVVISEIKKIFNLKMVLLLIIINIVMYFLFIEFNVKYFPNGRPYGDIYRIMVQMQKDYGTQMDSKEFENFKSIYKEKVKEADKYIEEHKEFSEIGIENYNEFTKAEDTKMNDKDRKKFQKLSDGIFFDKGVDLFWELQARAQIIQKYQLSLFSIYEFPTTKQIARIKEIINNKSDTSVFSGVIFGNYNDLIFYVSMTILLSIIFMISPIFLKDNKRNITSLQYTTKRGRKLFKSKVVAGSIAAFIISTTQLICMFILYSHNNVGMFFNANINSSLTFRLSWYDLTFIQYIVITVVAVYLLVFVVTIMTMLISGLVHNYIALVGIQLPIVFLLFKVALSNAVTRVVDIQFPKYSIPLWYTSMIVLITTLIFIRWRREKVTDIR